MKNLLLIISFFVFSNILFSQEKEYPIAEKKPFYYVTHGDSVLQNYNWMREKNSPDVINYLSSENTYAESKMKSTAILQKKIFEELRGRIKEENSSRPYRNENYYYYSRSVEGKDYGLYCRKKDSLTAKEEVYLNPNEMSKEFGYFEIQGTQISFDQSFLAFSINTDGGDFGTLHFKDLQRDSVLKDKLNNVGQFILLKDNKTVYYLKKDLKTKLGNQLFVHQVGTDSTSDKLLYQMVDGKGYLSIGLSESRKYLFVTTVFMGASGDVYAIDLESDDKTLRKVISGEKNVISGIDHIKGDYFLVVTNKNAPDFLLKEIEISNLKNERIFLPEEKGSKLQFYDFKGDYLILGRFKNGLDELYVLNLKTKEKTQIKGLDSIGVIGFSDQLKYDSTSIEYSYTSMVKSTTILKYNLIEKTSSLVWQDTVVKFDPNLYTTERLWAPSRDGKKIPVDVVYKKSLKKDGSNPMYITGYACYGMNQSPTFSKSSLVYLDRNFVFAIAHPRGESILGEEWHTDGKLLKKENTIHDFVDATQYMVDLGFTSPKKIVAQGGSAGGLLMGGVANERPDLYGGIIADVPFVNTLEDMLDTIWPNIKYHFAEIGNPYIKKEYQYIKSYSPLHNIKHQNYPNMLVTNGYNDSRVPFWAAAQYVAKLRDYKTDSNLLLLKTTMEGGHFGASGRYGALKEYAFKIAFALQSVGVKEDYLAVNGRVVDSGGDPIAYANVFVDGTSNGTVTNFDGDFYLELKQGQKFEIVFQTFGFKKYTYVIDSKTKVKDVRIVLQTEAKELDEVEISAKSKDKGPEIIRKANQRMEYYNQLLDNYSVDVYVRGADRLDSIPKKLPAFLKSADMPDTNDLGLMFLSESVTRYHFQQPDNYKEEMLSSRIAGRSNGLSNNRVGQVKLNFYQNNIQLMLEKPFLSPIADGGILLYKYSLESKFYDDDKPVYKIKVTPRNKAEAVFSGYIYINDKTWSIHSVDLLVTKETGVTFLDTLFIKQTYGYIHDSISIPRSVTLNMRYKVFGFQAGFIHVASFYNYQFNKKFPKKFFQKQVFEVAKDANKKDSAYWEQNRQIVLTAEESKYTTKLDTMKEKVYDDAFFDSLNKKRNKLTLDKLFINGFTYYKGKYNYSISGLLSDLGYNSVEGLRSQMKLEIYNNYATKEDGPFSYKRKYINAHVRYGVSSQRWYGKLGIGNDNLNEQKGWRVGVEKYIYQFNGNDPIMPIVDAGYNLLMRQNFAKFYEKTGLVASYSDLLTSGPRINIQLEYSQRSALQNHADWYLLPKIKDQITSNNPLNPLNDSIGFKTHNALILKFSGSYTYGERYEMIYSYRRVIDSRYPTIYWDFEQAIKALGSAVGYGRYQLGIGKSLNLGYWGKSNVDVIAGGFINHNSTYFMDYKHFNGNQTIFLKNGTDGFGSRSQLNNFNTLTYYGFSTKDNYLELHYQHRFLGLFLTKIPLLNRLHLEEVAGYNAAFTSGNRNYQELFVGVENIAKVFRIDFVATYKVNEPIRPMVRIGIKRPI